MYALLGVRPDTSQQNGTVGVADLPGAVPERAGSGKSRAKTVTAEPLPQGGPEVHPHQKQGLLSLFKMLQQPRSCPLPG